MGPNSIRGYLQTQIKMIQNTLKIMVVDHEKKLYQAYENQFESFLEFSLEGIFPTVNEAIQNYENIFPDVIFMEVSLPDICGIEGISLFREKDSQVKIVMLSAINDFELVKRAFRMSANGFVTKPLNDRSLYNALFAIHREGVTISDDVAKKVIATFQRKSRSRFSERENQVIDHLCQGATYKTIAEKLFVTPSAINFHIQNIYLKLDVNSKSEALQKIRQLEHEYPGG